MEDRAIISGMAVSPEDLAAGALALQVFVKNAKNVEMIVNIAFAVVPTILGLGAAGLIGSGVIQTAKEVVRSISLLGSAKKLRWMDKGGGGDKPPTPTPAAPAPAAMVGMEASRENSENKADFLITLQPPTIKNPDKGEGRENSPEGVGGQGSYPTKGGVG